MKTAKQWANEMRTGAHGGLARVLEMALSYMREADSKEQEYMVFLRGLELSDLWRAADSGTFESYLQNNGLSDTGRYRRGLMAIEEIEPDVLATVGMSAGKQLVRINDPAKRKQAIAKCTASAHERGAPLPARTAVGIVKRFMEEGPTPRSSRIETLEKENTTLRAEIDRLRMLIERLGGDPDEIKQSNSVAEGKKKGKQHRSQTTA